MATPFKVPLSPEQQTFNILLSGTFYQFTLKYADNLEGGWLLDIGDQNGNTILAGAPLVTGHDLLQQYAYLNIPGKLVIYTDGDADAVPTFTNLGNESNLYFVTDP